MRSSQREVPSTNAWYQSMLCILGKKGLERMKRVPVVRSAGNKQDGASIPHSPRQSVRENSPTVPVTPPLTPIGEKRCTPMTIKKAVVRSPPSPIWASSPPLPFWEREIVSFIFISEPFTFFGFSFRTGQRPPSPSFPEPHIFEDRQEG
ncbi:hypothetical protein HOY80DRAFT_1012673 [Tuber brumale]|nr:hypothetical protein HOY80DRAFT_1012673 [Tuber brumale]